MSRADDLECVTLMVPPFTVRFPSTLMPMHLCGSALHSVSVHLPPEVAIVIFVSPVSLPTTMLASVCMPLDPPAVGLMSNVPPEMFMSPSHLMPLQSSCEMTAFTLPPANVAVPWLFSLDGSGVMSSSSVIISTCIPSLAVFSSILMLPPFIMKY